MEAQSPGAALAARVAARIREFCSARGISAEALTRAANLSPVEVALLDAESENMTRNMLERIAAVFEVHPAVLCMSPDEHAIAKLLEAQRDLPKDKFQKLAGELISKGFSRSQGSA
jgi:transcriptional regulator with XRE-family HTH domain